MSKKSFWQKKENIYDSLKHELVKKETEQTLGTGCWNEKRKLSEFYCLTL